MQAVTIEGSARARLKLDLPIRQLGKFDRQSSNWHVVRWSQRDGTPNGIRAEFVISWRTWRAGFPMQKIAAFRQPLCSLVAPEDGCESS